MEWTPLLILTLLILLIILVSIVFYGSKKLSSITTTAMAKIRLTKMEKLIDGNLSRLVAITMTLAVQYNVGGNKMTMAAI